MREPKQKRSQRTLARLLAAAAELFEAQGVDATGIADVAKRAKSSVGSLYGRFEGKTDLAQAVDQLLWERVTARWIGGDPASIQAPDGPDHAASANSDTPLPEIAGLLNRLHYALEPEHSARASIDEFLKKEGAEPAGPAVLDLLVEEVRDALAAELTPAPTTDQAPEVLGFLAHIAVNEANAGTLGASAESGTPHMAALSAGDVLPNPRGGAPLAYVIAATLAELSGVARTGPEEQTSSAPVVDPFDIWA